MSDARPRFSQLIVYVDESGDHGPVSPEFPVFVLAFCVFDKTEYAEAVTTAMHALKFRYFGHDTAVLHERDIRKELCPFEFLRNADGRRAFLADLTKLVESSPFTLVAAVIDKAKLQSGRSEAASPYQLALQFGLERIEEHRRAMGDEGRLHVVFESRGKNEDRDLELRFRRVCDNNALGVKLDHEPIFARKDANHCGLQLADLCARPIGVRAIRPEQPNRAYEVLEKKLGRSPTGDVEGWGIRCFP